MITKWKNKARQRRGIKKTQSNSEQIKPVQKRNAKKPADNFIAPIKNKKQDHR